MLEAPMLWLRLRKDDPIRLEVDGKVVAVIRPHDRLPNRGIMIGIDAPKETVVAREKAKGRVRE